MNVQEVWGFQLGSFKVKLVVYFLLLSVLPMAAAFWGFTAVAGQSETRHVDARLQAGLRAALAGYQEQLDAAQGAAAALAHSRPFQLELERRDRPGLTRMLRDVPNIYVVAGNGFHVGRNPGVSAQRQVAVVTQAGLVGRVIAFVPFDSTLLDAVRARSGLAPADALALVLGNRIVTATPDVEGTLALAPGRTATVRIGGARYRALAASSLGDVRGVHFAALSPQSLIDSANSASRNRLLLGLLASLAVVSIVAYLEGRSIVRNLRNLARSANAIAHGRLGERVEVRGRDEFAELGTAFNEMASQLQARLDELDSERARLRDAITRFGEALAATHDVGQLLRVIVEAAVEATGATGARLTADGGSIVESGDPDADGQRLELPISAGQETFGALSLVGPAFDGEQRMTAASLASHAAIALENARLHRIVERQAMVDGLTGIANRRACEEALASEIAQADRLGTTLTLVLADLDDFKRVNDEHGHAAGDDVLREFASVIRATVRDSDVAGRWGGEEFLLLLPGADAAGGAQLAERVRTTLAERSFLGAHGAVLTVGCSFGVAQHATGGDARDLFAAADRALYRAKRAGKNRVETDAPVRSF
ncbi:MAG TPA: diguanylate cyclase [Gaiellaceae bacterium]|nr:diguanylate cyclase [Gaiellaceae bacterium]